MYKRFVILFIMLCMIGSLIIACSNDTVTTGSSITKETFDINEFEQGKVKDMEFGIGSTKIDIEKKLKNQVEVKTGIHGEEYLEVNEYQFYFNDDQLVKRIEARPQTSFYVEDVKEALGKPTDETNDPGTSAWTLIYKYEEYLLVFYFVSEDEKMNYFKLYQQS